MKSLLSSSCLICSLFFSLIISAQDPNAILDLESTTDGVLLPRMTESQRDAIVNTAEGLMIYQTTDPAGFYYYDGSNWKQVGEGITNSLWQENGLNIYRDTGKVSIGTDDPLFDFEVSSHAENQSAIMVLRNPSYNHNLLLQSGDADHEPLISFKGSDALRIGYFDGSLHHLMRLTNYGNVGIGTETPDYNLEVAADQEVGHIGVTTYRESGFGAGNFSARAARGTIDNPLPLQEGDFLASFSARGYGTTGFSGPPPQGRIGVVAAENWTDTSQGTHMFFTTTNRGATSSAERMRITADGFVGIGVHEPSHLLEVIGNSGEDFRPIAYFENTVDSVNGELIDGVGVMGICDVHDFSGYGGYFRGGYSGVRGRVFASDSFYYVGTSGTVTGGAGSNYGVTGYTDGAGTNHGIWGRARGGQTNYGIYGEVDTTADANSYAGYFRGDTYVDGRLGVGSTIPNHKLEVLGDSEAAHTPIAYFENFCDTVDGNLVDAYGIMAVCENQDWAGYGGLFRGGFVGAWGEVNPTDTFSYFGLMGKTTGGSGLNNGVYGWANGAGTNRAVRGFANGNGINYGVVGLARGGTINYGIFGQSDTSGVPGTFAGFFEGDAFISGYLGIGTETPDYELQVNGDIVPELGGSFNLGANTLGWDTLYMSSTIDYASNLHFTSEGNMHVTMTTSGMLGIGTDGPQDRLHVLGNIRIGDISDDDGSTASYGDRLYFSGADDWPSWNSDNSDPLWMARFNVDENESELRVGIGDDNWGSDKFVVGIEHSDTVWVPHMAVLGTGNVGIGTTAPSEKLEVDGKIKTDSLQLTEGASDGHVLTSDASGNASWQAPPSVGMVPLGTILPWAKGYLGASASLPEEFVECDGSQINDPESPFNGYNSPDLNNSQRFLRGATSSGNIGGSNTHDHGGATGTPSMAQNANAGTGISQPEVHLNHTHSVSVASSLPLYYEVVWIMRIK